VSAAWRTAGQCPGVYQVGDRALSRPCHAQAAQAPAGGAGCAAACCPDAGARVNGSSGGLGRLAAAASAWARAWAVPAAVDGPRDGGRSQGAAWDGGGCCGGVARAGGPACLDGRGTESLVEKGPAAAARRWGAALGLGALGASSIALWLSALLVRPPGLEACSSHADELARANGLASRGRPWQRWYVRGSSTRCLCA